MWYIKGEVIPFDDDQKLILALKVTLLADRTKYSVLHFEDVLRVTTSKQWHTSITD